MKLTIEEIEKQIEATTEVAKIGTSDELLKSAEELQAKLNQGTLIGLMCHEARMKAKFAALEKALNKRI